MDKNQRETICFAAASLLRRDEALLGVLVFGSTGRGTALPSSDVDLICLTSLNRERQMYRRLCGLDLDVFFLSHERALATITADIRSNNNHVLAGFTEGTIIDDPHGYMAEIKAKATELWMIGPREITPWEVPKVRAWLRRCSLSVRNLNAKAIRSTCWPAIADTQCAVYFNHMIYAYCRVKRLWASSLFVLLNLEDVRYAEIQQLCRNYLTGASLQDRTDAVVAISSTICGYLEVFGKINQDNECYAPDTSGSGVLQRIRT